MARLGFRRPNKLEFLQIEDELLGKPGFAETHVCLDAEKRTNGKLGNTELPVVLKTRSDVVNIIECPYISGDVCKVSQRKVPCPNKSSLTQVRKLSHSGRKRLSSPPDKTEEKPSYTISVRRTPHGSIEEPFPLFNLMGSGFAAMHEDGFEFETLSLQQGEILSAQFLSDKGIKWIGYIPKQSGNDQRFADDGPGAAYKRYDLQEGQYLFFEEDLDLVRSIKADYGEEGVNLADLTDEARVCLVSKGELKQQL
ncbi:hypothetical protein K9M41_03760 [Candidatus Gracilibacteria bacterium]|nr:hypothetical protein [Candidatus Gracilibacteria bacterium]